METYDVAAERRMRLFFESLSEKDRRRYAAMEAARLGHGGVDYVAGVLGCDPKNVRRGRTELAAMPAEASRRPGPEKEGGRRPDEAGCGGRPGAVSAALIARVADAVVNAAVGDVAPAAWGDSGTNVAATTSTATTGLDAAFAVGQRAVKRLLRRHRFGRRKLSKNMVMGDRPGRDAQFLNIARLTGEYLAAGEDRGQHRHEEAGADRQLLPAGHRLRHQAGRGVRPRLPSFGEGVVIPHGVYDLARNVGHVTLGTSHDTSAFACDSVRLRWARQGKAA